MTQFSIHTTFHKWLQIQDEKQKVQNGVFIFGNVSTGKTTLCHLLKRYVNKIKDDNLIIQQGKYIYDNELNPKSSLKSLTIYPKLFKIKHEQNKQVMNIIQVPSRIYQLQPKKRPNLDRILNTVGLTNAVKQLSMIFIIQSKNTSSKIQVWKKSFQTILDYFSIDLLSEQFFNSVGFLATKSDIDKNVFINRFELLSKNLDVEQRQIKRKNKYKQLVQTIQKQKNVAILSKPTKNSQQKAQIQTKQIYDMLYNLQKITIDQKILENQQPAHLIQCQQKYLNQYKIQLENILSIFKTLFIQILFKSGYKNLNRVLEQDFNIILQKTETKIFGNCQQKSTQNWKIHSIDEQMKALFNSKQNIEKCYDFIQVIKFYSNLKQKFYNSSQILYNSSVKQFFEILKKYGLIRNSWRNIYSFMIQFQIFEQRFKNRIANLTFKDVFQSVFSELFSCSKNKQLSTIFLNITIPKGRQPQYYHQVLQIVHLLFPNIQNQDDQTKKKIQMIKFQLQFFGLDLSKPQKYLPVLWQLRKSDILRQNNSQSKKIIRSFMQILAKMLDRLSHYKLAANIYENCGLFYTAKCKYQQFLEEQKLNITKKQTIYKYINLLIKMHFYEKALEVVFRFAEYNHQIGQQIKQKLIQVQNMRNKNQKFDNEFMNKVFNQTQMNFQDYLNETLKQEINLIVKNQLNVQIKQ